MSVKMGYAEVAGSKSLKPNFDWAPNGYVQETTKEDFSIFTQPTK